MCLSLSTTSTLRAEFKETLIQASSDFLKYEIKKRQMWLNGRKPLFHIDVDCSHSIQFKMENEEEVAIGGGGACKPNLKAFYALSFSLRGAQKLPNGTLSKGTPSFEPFAKNQHTKRKPLGFSKKSLSKLLQDKTDIILAQTGSFAFGP